MAVDLYSGVPGSGKSLFATYQIIEWLSAGKNVIANFPIDMNFFKRKRHVGNFVYLPTDEMNPKYFIQFANEHHKKSKKAQTLVVIDEASMLFNSRTWQKADRSDWIFFLANHRHLNFDFIVIAQLDRMLDRQIRGIIETDYRCRAMKAFGIIGKILNFVTGGLFAAVPYNMTTKTKTFIPHYFRLHRRKARVYDTMQLFQNMEGGLPSETKYKRKLSEDGKTDCNNIVMPGVVPDGSIFSEL